MREFWLPKKREGDIHVAHGDHVVDLANAKPVQDVGHECLESHVLDTRNELRRAEILVRRITATLAQVIHEVSKAAKRAKRMKPSRNELLEE